MNKYNQYKPSRTYVFLIFGIPWLFAILFLLPLNTVSAQGAANTSCNSEHDCFTVCHDPSGHHVIFLTLPMPALDAHLGHGDKLVLPGEIASKENCVDPKLVLPPDTQTATGNGHLYYANSGSGKYKDRILFMDWKDSALQDGIQEGDTVEFTIPEQSCLAKGKLTATFSNIDDPGDIARSAKPVDMKTWDGSGFYKLYDTAGKGEAIYTTEYMLEGNEKRINLGFTVNWRMVIDGETVKPDIFLIDAESTTDNSEQIDALTDGDYWSVVENARSTAYVVDGLGTSEVNIKNTEHPRPYEVEGWSPLLLSRGMTRTQINITNYNSSHGKEGVAFALLAPCDHGDAPVSYGDAGHAFKEQAISPFKNELGLKFSPGTPYIGSIPPDSEFVLNDDNAEADDAAHDVYDASRNDDEDGVSIPPLQQGKSVELTIPVTEAGYLQGWIDWNGDGDFNDTGEQIVANKSANGGDISLSVNVPNDARIGQTFARFRYGSEQNVGATGYAKDGEVEDASVQIVEASVCRIDDLASDLYSSASLAANSGYLTKNTRVYQAKFNTANWEGQLVAYDLKTQDHDGNVKSEQWNAADLMSRSGRSLFSYNPSSPNKKGIEFKWKSLNKQQKAALRGNDSNKIAKKRLSWLQGSDADEGSLFRQRATILGDIIHSSLTYQGNYANYGYKYLKGSEHTTYADYLKAKTNTRSVIYVGANDGMLHAIDAELGEEWFAYAPNEIYSKLATISDPKYGCKQPDCLKHEYLVDGAATVGDVYIDTGSGKNWHTVLVGALGLGGKGVFALDVSDPTTFNQDNVLWELSASQSPDHADDYASLMGYSLPAARIARMKSGHWAAIVANGYDSAAQTAALFIIDIETGKLIRKLVVPAIADTKNGLSTPTPVDSNGDYIVDAIYAGDLQGNLWAFDVNDDDPANWSIKYGSNAAPEPLFRACETVSCEPAQSITAPPQVGRHPSGGLMIYFGTGKYFDVSDNRVAGDKPQVHAFYGIRDNGVVVSKSNLVQQSILNEVGVETDLNSRITTSNPVDYGSRQGWFMDLVSPQGQREQGERVISQALLRDGRIIFTTMTPPQNDCVWGGKSWIMEFNALDGRRLDVIPFDVNNDKEFTTADNVDLDGVSTIISGVQRPSLGVIFSTPEVISHTTRIEGKYVTGTGGQVGMIRESASRFSGRMSWRKIR